MRCMRRFRVVFFAAFCLTVVVNVVNGLSTTDPAEILWTYEYPKDVGGEIRGVGTYSISSGCLEGVALDAYAVDGGIMYSAGGGCASCKNWDINVPNVSGGDYYCFGKLQVTGCPDPVTVSTVLASLAVAGGAKTPKGEVKYAVDYPMVANSKILTKGTVTVVKDWVLASKVLLAFYPKNGGKMTTSVGDVTGGNWEDKAPPVLSSGTYVVVAYVILKNSKDESELEFVNAKVVEKTIP